MWEFLSWKHSQTGGEMAETADYDLFMYELSAKCGF